MLTLEGERLGMFPDTDIGKSGAGATSKSRETQAENKEAKIMKKALEVRKGKPDESRVQRNSS